MGTRRKYKFNPETGKFEKNKRSVAKNFGDKAWTAAQLNAHNNLRKAAIKGRKRAAAKKKLEKRLRAQEVMALRLKGLSYDEIAEQTNLYSTGTDACKALQGELNRFPSENAEQLREIENRRLDEMLVAVWDKAKEGRLGYVQCVLKIIHERVEINALKVESDDAKDYRAIILGGQWNIPFPQEQMEALKQHEQKGTHLTQVNGSFTIEENDSEPSHGELVPVKTLPQ